MGGYRLFGDSHCNAVIGGRIALQNRGEAVPAQLDGCNMLGAATVFYDDFHRREGGDIVLTHPLFQGRMAGLCDESGRMLSPGSGRYLVSMGLHTQTLLASRLFLHHAPSFVAPRPARAFVSQAALAAVLRRYHRRTLQFLRDLLEVGAQVTVVSAPPPTRRFPILSSGYDEADVIALDGFLRDFVLGQLDGLGIAVIPPPPEAADETGFLRPKYLMDDPKDCHHGNRDYGALMLGQIARHLDRAGAGAVLA